MTEQESLHRFLQRDEPRHTFRPSEELTSEDKKAWEKVESLDILKAIGWDKVQSLNWIFEVSPLGFNSEELEAIEARKKAQSRLKGRYIQYVSGPMKVDDALFFTGERLIELLHDLHSPDDGYILAVPKEVDCEAWKEICKTYSSFYDFQTKREDLIVLSLDTRDNIVWEIFTRDDDIAESIWSGLGSPEDLMRFRTGFVNPQTGLLWALGLPLLIALPAIGLYLLFSRNLVLHVGLVVYIIVLLYAIPTVLRRTPKHLESVQIHDISFRLWSGSERKTVRFEDISLVTWARGLVSRKMMIVLKSGEEVLLRPVGEDMFQGILMRVREVRIDLQPTPAGADLMKARTGSLEDAAHRGQGERIWEQKWKGSPDHEYTLWGRRPKKR